MDLVSDMTQVSIKGSTSSKTNAERRETEERYRYKMFKHMWEMYKSRETQPRPTVTGCKTPAFAA